MILKMYYQGVRKKPRVIKDVIYQIEDKSEEQTPPNAH